ncbi:MAG: metallophosphoesterase family protein [Anaerolineae bacterium]
MDAWTFAHVADMQPGSPRSFRYNPSWARNWAQARQQIAALEPDLLLVGGDLTRDGSIHRFELEAMRADLAALPFPVHVIPGNMDTGNKHTDRIGLHRGPGQQTDLELNVTSAQLQQFADVFAPLHKGGALWWSSDHKGVRFSGLADMVVNSGLPEEADFWRWAETQAVRSQAERHVWITHYPLFVEDPDEPNWDLETHYREWYFSIDQPGRGRLLDLFKATGADLVISGHVHCHKVTYHEGTRFEIAPATSFAQWADRWPDGDPTLGFLRYDVTPEGITPTFVPLARTYDLPGYGPGGHPAPSIRDYSLAWAKAPSDEESSEA